MSEKKKFCIEYEIKSSPRILYTFLNEPNGLTQWFADDVSVRDQVYTFTWDGEQQKAYYSMDEIVAEAWKATAIDHSSPTQREFMCGLVAEFGMNEDRVVQEYAAAEQNGDVNRKSNEYGTPPEAYARALWRDGVRKGWLTH